MNDTYLGAKRATIYRCDSCDFNCIKKYDYERHLSTRKHLKIHEDNETGAIAGKQSYSCDCGNVYKYHSGLSRHKKTCTHTTDEVSDDKIDTLSNTIMMLVKQNQEFKQLLIDQNKQMIEMIGNMGNTVNNNNTNNNVNSHNTFNLNVFLNENCKNAMSLTDFVNSMNLTIEDFIQTGELGFVDGISKVMAERIDRGQSLE